MIWYDIPITKLICNLALSLNTNDMSLVTYIVSRPPVAPHFLENGNGNGKCF